MELSFIPLCVGICLVVVTCQDILDFNEGEICKIEKHVNWTCKRVKDCPKAQEDLRMENIPQLCKSKGSGPDNYVVCCEPQPSTIAANKCKEYAEYVYEKIYDPGDDSLKKHDTCTSSQPLIVNGVDAEPKEFLHMALIGYGEKRNENVICGGSLISASFVLSAAHCTTNPSTVPSWVRLGDYNFKSTEDEANGLAKSVEFGIQEIITHPKYKSPQLYHDIALFKLDQRVTFNEYIRPICLQTEHEIPVDFALASGWGVAYWSGGRKSILQKGNQTFVSVKQCNDSYKDTSATTRTLRLPLGISDDAMLCAEDKQNGAYIANGDSGGPLQYRPPTPYCMYNLVGVTSFGSADGNRPGVFTRVSSYVEWIVDKVWL